MRFLIILFVPIVLAQEIVNDCVQDNVLINITNIAKDAEAQPDAPWKAQQFAAEQAAFQVKSVFADKAALAAKVAEAIYLGKQSLVEQLQRQLAEARVVRTEESQNLEVDKQTLAAAQAARNAAKQELCVLEKVTNLTKQLINLTTNIVNKIQEEVTKLESKYSQAKVQKLENLDTTEHNSQDCMCVV